MGWTDTTTKRIWNGSLSGASGAGAVADNGTITVSVGDFVVVGVVSLRSAGPQPTLHVSDDGGGGTPNTWDNSTCAVSYESTNGVASTLRWSTITTGGNLTISLNGNGTNSYPMEGFIHVFQNPNASPASGTAVTANDGGVSSTPMDTTAFTAADSDALYVAVAGLGNGRTITQNNAAGDTDWTLSNEQEAATFVAGSMVFKIQTGAATSRRAAWGLDSAGTWATTILAFKPAAGDVLWAQSVM